jgi:cytochrome oxidase Cu insertion factor (SCO1/SenC/PrrC family)
MSIRYWVIVGALALVAAIAGVFVAREVSRPGAPLLESGTMLPQPRVLADFSLVDALGAHASPRELRGHPTLVFFGFTHCPDVCPTTLALLANVQKEVARQDETLAGLRVALISVDPERDTPEQLGRYVASFGSDLIAHFQRGVRARGFARRQLHRGSFRHRLRARLAGAHRRSVHATPVRGGARP